MKKKEFPFSEIEHWMVRIAVLLLLLIGIIKVLESRVVFVMVMHLQPLDAKSPGGVGIFLFLTYFLTFFAQKYPLFR